MFQMCQNPNGGVSGCGCLATVTVEAVNQATGKVEDTTESCANCADSVTAPPGYEVRRS